MERSLSIFVDDFDEFYLRLETTNRCNFECSFCTHRKITRPLGDMDFGLYCKIIREASSLGIKNLDIRNFGEPLLDANLEDKIIFARQNGINNIVLTTNASLLSKDRYLSLAQTGLSHISVSLSPKREYEETRNRPFDFIMNNLAQILTIKEEVPITIHIISTEFSTSREFLRLGYDLTKLGYEWVRDFVHNWAEGEFVEHDIPCKRLWDSITVNWDGLVPLCCMDYDGKEILGDVKVESLAGIINSERYRNMRLRHLDRDYPLLCKMCNFIKL